MGCLSGEGFSRTGAANPGKGGNCGRGESGRCPNSTPGDGWATCPCERRGGYVSEGGGPPDTAAKIRSKVDCMPIM